MLYDSRQKDFLCLDRYRQIPVNSKLARYKNQKAALLGKNLVGILFLMVGKFL